MKTRHDGDCSIYAVLSNKRPEDGICTCGYGRQLAVGGDFSKMYSEELKEKIGRDSQRSRSNDLTFFLGDNDASE